MSNDNRHKHLELISETVSRMSQNSFNVRSWCIAVVSAMVALAVESNNREIALSSILPIFVFLLVDAYYLALERKFRAVYDHVRKLPESKIDFSMSYSEVPEQSFLSALNSGIYWLLYGGLFASVFLVSFAL